MRYIPALLFFLLSTSTAVADETSVELPEPAPSPKTEVTTPTMDDRVSSVESTTVQLYERVFRAEARMLRIETIFSSLEQRGLILTPSDLSGELIERTSRDTPVHIHRWRLTNPTMVKMDGGRKRSSAICHCGGFTYVETASSTKESESK